MFSLLTRWVFGPSDNRSPDGEEAVIIERIQDLILRPVTGEEDILQEIWQSFYSGLEFERPSQMWKDIGFQGPDPLTDIRGGGMLSMLAFLYFVKSEPGKVPKMVERQIKRRSETNSEKGYPFSSAVINVTRKLCEKLGIIQSSGARVSDLSGQRLRCWHLLVQDNHMIQEHTNIYHRYGIPTGFLDIFCLSFEAFDQSFSDKDGSYMEFNIILDEAMEHFFSYRLNISPAPKSILEIKNSFTL